MPCTSEASKDTEAPRSSSPDHRDPDYWAKVADKEIHTDIQTYRHTDIQTYRHTYIHTYVHTCMLRRARSTRAKVARPPSISSGTRPVRRTRVVAPSLSRTDQNKTMYVHRDRQRYTDTGIDSDTQT